MLSTLQEAWHNAYAWYLENAAALFGVFLILGFLGGMSYLTLGSPKMLWAKTKAFPSTTWFWIKRWLAVRHYQHPVRQYFRKKRKNRLVARTIWRENMLVTDMILADLDYLNNFGMISDGTKRRWLSKLQKPEKRAFWTFRTQCAGAELGKKLSARKMEGLIVEHCSKLPGYQPEVTKEYIEWRNARHAAVVAPRNEKEHGKRPTKPMAAPSADAILARVQRTKSAA